MSTTIKKNVLHESRFLSFDVNMLGFSQIFSEHKGELLNFPNTAKGANISALMQNLAHIQWPMIDDSLTNQ